MWCYKYVGNINITIHLFQPNTDCCQATITRLWGSKLQHDIGFIVNKVFFKSGNYTGQ